MFTPFAFVKQEAAAPSITGLLDLYPNAARAYSVRKLRNAYTGAALRVKRSSDNTEQDIGFIGENLDTSSLSSFVGAGNGIVVTWYDQSGNGVNATAGSGFEPTIVSSGTIETTGTKPCLKSVNDYMDFTAITNLTTYTQLIVGKKNTSTGDKFIGFSDVSSGNSPTLSHFNDNNIYFQWEDYYVFPTSTIANTNYEVIIGSTLSSTTATIARNGSTLTLNSPVLLSAISTTVNGIMRYGGEQSNAQFQEMILWQSQQNSNFTGIQNNINTYYSIY